MKYPALILAAALVSGCATQSGSTGDAGASQRAKLRAELGSAYFAQGQMAIALEEFNEALRIDGNYAPAYVGLGLVRAALRQDEMAEASFKRALKLDPESSEAHNNYGTFLCSRDRIDESIAEFKAALSNPLYATPELAYLNAGVCALKKNDDRSAESYLNSALQLNPNLRQADFQLANLYHARGDMLQARMHLEKSMRGIDPSPEMLWLGVRIERVLGDKDAEASYSLLLRNKYPDSEQTKLLLAR